MGGLSWAGVRLGRDLTFDTTDVFATTIAAAGIILDFVGACVAYSEEAKSLRVRFEWDLRALKAVRDYFEQRKAQNANQELSTDDAMLLEQTADYLDSIASKAQRSLRKLKRKGFLSGIVNRGMWIARQADLKEMEAEVYAWTRRFDVRVLGLPQELNSVIPVGVDTSPGVVRSNKKLQDFLNLPLSRKTEQARSKRLENSKQLADRIMHRGGACFFPIQEGNKQLICASRRVPLEATPGSPSFLKLEHELGVLSAALGCIDSDADIRLLSVDSYFYHEDTNQFLFTHVLPYPIFAPMTLVDVIHRDTFSGPYANLNERFALAQDLAEAVLFLHTAGFVHKNITSSSVVALQRSRPDSSHLPDCYLMGFNLVRGVDGRTYQEGAVRDSGDEERPIWEFDIFQHPDRLLGKNSLRYTKTHDVYSLGVLLLKIGAWKRLLDVVLGLNDDDPSSWKDELLEAASTLGPTTGTKYQQLVDWCLRLDGNEVVTEDMFVKNVLDPLEEIVNAL
ncbi:hypothetical protein F5Y10DRAFT_282130 [Nemania abortiva]|nr:hypothetical protein F5Y10DRAFT_282130 [Nemania abortiva]